MKRFKDLKKRNDEYKEQYKLLEDYMNSQHLGWEKTDDANHIKMRLNQATKAILENKSKQKKKVIKKSQYKGDWPFTSDEITIVKTGKLWITCIIDNKEYALNGLAQEAMPWLKFPHGAGKVPKGKSVGPFIQIGKKL